MLLILAAVAPTVVVSIACRHSKMKLPTLKVPQVAGATIDVPTSYRPLKISFSMEGIDNAEISSAHKTLFKELVLPRLSAWAAKNVQVNGPTTISDIPAGVCSASVVVPQAYIAPSFSVTADLIIFALAEWNSNTNYVAQAGPCGVNSYNSRPNIGFIRFNAFFISLEEESFDQYIRVALHELFHVLVFSPGLFGMYNNGGQKPYYITANRYYLNSTNVLAFLRTHLNCPQIIGVPLEDQGTSLSHFEKSVLGNEIMTAEMGDEMPVSGLIVALMNDSGWYQMAADSAEQFWWGKGKGCDFYTLLCASSATEFCPKVGVVGCTADFRSGAVCSSNNLTNRCLTRSYAQSYFCDQIYTVSSKLAAPFNMKGPSSRCFNAADSSGKSLYACLPSTCNADGSLTIVGQKTSYTCKESAQTLQIENHTVKCPDITTFCTMMSLNVCPSDCGGRGYCRLDGSCNCRYGYSGKNCDKVELCSVINSDLCKSITGDLTKGQRLFPLLLALVTLLYF